MLMRSWAQDMEANAPVSGDRGSDWEAICGLDLENAYGRVHRSACMRGAIANVGGLAPLLAAEWQTQATVVFCLGLESTWGKVDMLKNGSGIAR
eukprot:10220817-Karenia_brevis.AAC.1